MIVPRQEGRSNIEIGVSARERLERFIQDPRDYCLGRRRACQVLIVNLTLADEGAKRRALDNTVVRD